MKTWKAVVEERGAAGLVVTHSSRTFDAPTRCVALAIAMTWAKLQAGKMKGVAVEEIGARKPKGKRPSR